MTPAVTVLTALFFTGPVEGKRFVDVSENSYYWSFVAGDPRSARRFLSAVATAVAVLSSVVIAMMWFGAWVLSPCWQ